MKARFALLAALALVLGPLVAPPHAATQAGTRTEAELRTLLRGAWHLTVARAAGQATIDAAIERSVSDMNYFLQGVARDQLRANTPCNERIDIDFPGTDITVVFDQRFSYTTRPGIPTDFDVEGQGNVAIRQYFRDGHLEQYFEATLGRRWNLYELSPDGTTMTVRATQTGPMMPTAMAFTLTYRQRH